MCRAICPTAITNHDKIEPICDASMFKYLIFGTGASCDHLSFVFPWESSGRRSGMKLEVRTQVNYNHSPTTPSMRSLLIE